MTLFFNNQALKKTMKSYYPDQRGMTNQLKSIT